MKNFMEPEMNVVRFNAEDIITTSGGPGNDNGPPVPNFVSSYTTDGWTDGTVDSGNSVTASWKQ